MGSVCSLYLCHKYNFVCVAKHVEQFIGIKDLDDNDGSLGLVFMNGLICVFIGNTIGRLSSNM